MKTRSQRKQRRSGKAGSRRASRFHRRSTFIPDGYLAVGRVLGAHGLLGEVKVESHSDFDSRFTPGQQLFIGEKLAQTEIETSRPHKGIFLIRFTDVSDRFKAEDLYSEWLYIPEEKAMELDEDTYWVHDIVGLTVQTEDLRRLGKVADVLFTGANEVYIVRPEPGVNRDRDLLIPALADVVRAVDVEAGILTVRLQPGLLEDDVS